MRNFGLYNDDDYNWFSGGVDNTLWTENSKSTHDPCPDGWRVPTFDELNALLGNKEVVRDAGWDSTNKGYWLDGTTSPSSGNGLFLPAAGVRDIEFGEVRSSGETGYYWSSSIDEESGSGLSFNDGIAGLTCVYRSYGCSVRCVKE